MVSKKLLAAALSVLTIGSAVKLPSASVTAADIGEEYLCRDYHDVSGSRHYIDNYNTATSTHFQIFWGNDDQTGLINDTFIQLNLDNLEKYYDIYINELGMNDASESVFEPDGKKYKTNIYLTRTGLPDFPDGWAFMGSEPYTGFAYIFCDPGALTQEDGTDSAALPHEYGHVLTYHQKAWTDQVIDGPWWEATANWFKEQYFDTLDTPDTHFFLPYLRNMELTIPHGRMYYEAWIFLQYLSENPDNYPVLGKDFMKRLLTEALPEEYPFDTIERLADCDMKDLMGDFAKRMATLDFKHKELYNERLDQALQDPFVWQLIYTQPLPAPDKDNCYIVPAEKAPMQSGLNIIPLNIEGRRISVTLRGISDAEEADWRACLVTEKKDGTTHYSPLFSERTMTIGLDGDETALYLTVAATPDRIIPNNIYDKAEGSDKYSYNQCDYKRRYPYEFDIKGASPMYRDIKADVPGHPHPNGGGFVADTAKVDKNVYVGPDAMVLGDSVVTRKAVITGHAVVNNATVTDYARIGDHACVYGFWWATPTVSGYAKIGDRAVVTAGASISGNARVMGNAYILENFSVTDNATVKGTAYCYGNGVASGQAILDGDFFNECSVSHGAAFGWLESQQYNNSLPYTDGLYAGYEFDRSSSVFAYDTYGATNGILRNSPLWQETRSSAEGVITFNGKDQYMICDNTLGDYKNMEICTAILWRGGADEQRVFEFSGDGSMYFTPSNKDGVAEFSIGDTKITADTALEKGKWNIIRIIISNNNAQLRINGKTAASQRITTLPEALRTENSHFFIARNDEGNYFNGSMDYFRIYFKQGREPKYYYTDTELIYTSPTLYGDANCDGVVDEEDVDLIMQAVAFPSKYGLNGTDKEHLTEQGYANADVYEQGGGLTLNDALAINRYITGKTKSLPES